MKRMLIASSALALMAAPSFAQDSAYDPATQQPGASDERGDQRNGLHDGWSDDDHPLSGVAVYTNDGERVGSVERVRGGAGADAHAALADGASEDLDVTGLVIETGGFLGIGTRELDIELGQAQRTSVEGDERIILDMSNAEFERMREYARDDDDGDTSMRTGMSYTGTMDSRDAYRDDHPLKDVVVYTRDDDAYSSASQTEARSQAATENRTASQTRQARAETDARANASGEVHGDVYTDAHHWVGTPVYSSNGERLGAVHQVRAFSDTAYARGGDVVAMMEANPDVNAIVVRTGGVLGMGQRNVQIGIDRVELEMVDGDARLVFDGNAEAFREMPNHDDRATRRASNR